MKELLGTALFFAAVGLSADKINRDFGEHGLWGYATLLILTTIFAGAVGVAFA